MDNAADPLIFIQQKNPEEALSRLGSLACMHACMHDPNLLIFVQQKFKGFG